MLAAVLLIGGFTLWAETPEEKDAVAAVQKLFDGMAAKDGAAIRASMLADTRLYAVRENGAPTSASVDDFVKRISGIEGAVLERFTERPKVLIHGRVAQVWGEYDFLRGGKFDHCGVDTVSLFQTAEGWKIATIAYTSETTGCKGH
jgi:hypothetical protein